jgi:SAM-dependent methyltransferase
MSGVMPPREHDQREAQAADPDGYYKHRREYYRDATIATTYDASRFTGLRSRRHDRECEVIACALDVARQLDLARDPEARPLQDVLDVPTGTGRFLPLLLGRGLETYGADVSHEMIEQARGRVTSMSLACSGFVQADATALPWRDASFDVVMSMRFFFHLPSAVRVAVMREMSRVSRGWVLVDYRHAHVPRHHVRRWFHSIGIGKAAQPRPSRETIFGELRDAGLEPVRIFEIVPIFSDKWFVLARPTPKG